MTIPESIEAVVFDCDGVVVDSEGLAWRAWADVLARYGIAVAEADVEALTGGTQQGVYEAFATRGNLPPAGDVITTVDELTRQRIPRELGAFEDAVKAIRALRQCGVPLGLATSSGRARLDAMLAAVGLLDAFSVTTAGDEVMHGKPAPDIYEVTARRLDAEPRRCVAIEDTGTGVAAAKAADMRVLGVVRGHVNPAQLDAAHRVVERLSVQAILRLLRASPRRVARR